MSAEQLFLEAGRLIGLGETAAAEALLRAAVQAAPDFAEAHANLALLLERGGRATEAESHYRIALALQPERAQLQLNFGVLMASQKRFVDAELAYRRALEISPELAAAWSNLGVLLACTQREHEAEQCYRTALRLSPGYRAASYNLAYVLLRQGRYAEGWSCLEARSFSPSLEALLHAPRWRGEALQGASLLVCFEAGHGDMIQFCRYLPLLKARGAGQLTVVCQPALQRLFSRLPDVDEVLAFAPQMQLPACDFWVAPLSLPLLFGTTLATIPSTLPYLSVAEDWLRDCALPDDSPALRVGLAWKGNPLFENDADRSLPSLALLAPLAGIDGVRLYSLQKGEGEDEARHAPFPIVPLAARIRDFADTAALIAQLDLVISVDTAIAHLAGALRKPCWIMLPDYKPDWRWLAHRSDSPWYPGTMRLFRQARQGDWKPVIASLGNALQQHLLQRAKP